MAFTEATHTCPGGTTAEDVSLQHWQEAVDGGGGGRDSPQGGLGEGREVEPRHLCGDRCLVRSENGEVGLLYIPPSAYLLIYSA